MVVLPSRYSEVEAIYGQTIGANYRTLAITSSAPGEGKSTLAEALVKRAQSANKRVLLVELNTFNPVFKDKLASVLSSNNVNKDEQLMLTSQDKKLGLLQATQAKSSLVDYREASLLAESINLWLNDFDCVIFDTASLAMLNQHNIPADTVCQVCDGAILVVEAGRTPANLIEEGIAKLVAMRVNIIGTVINDKSNPTLLAELLRETRKFDKYLPSLMNKIRKLLSASSLLKVSI
ncbi:CpsD/CapB family tyrosine-protein kinase [Thalassotalea sp. M1531]|uniref:CpsD/CapB family tyrosine-protein kinase n=1 Tax=Thalassotalea algicola TaxID=2716224 RepID=A0A7Y0LEB4_9GAMM|nr:hypothetical protein [Thalassotalea algicola]NMP32101.1 CpsD/CapB family tyrosine-protein kinase [Thalassotalea algicola]